jgi:hypothetical protein
MKISPSAMVFVAGALAACHVYIDEPARQTRAAAPPPPPPPPAATPTAPAPEPARPAKTVTLRLHETAPPGSATTPPATACLDSGAAAAGDCAGMQASVGCTSVPTSQQKCNAYKTYFQPKVAAAAVSCMTKLTGSQVCDAAQASGCAKTALGQACLDQSVAQLCQIAAAPCKTNATDCVAAISGLNDQGKQLVAACVAQGCSAGLSACIDGLATTSMSASSKH